ncbi:MAG: TonB-dependent receptor [Flavobacteriaceae bacterium]|nr:MAG: TonB-dependent receptor [Flavobacteriaceae bacterium]
MSGIINIILKKNIADGFNGSLTLGLEHSKNSRPGGSSDFNYRTGIVNLFGIYNLDFGKYATISNLRRTDKELNQDFNYLDNTTTHYLKAGADIYINPANTLSFYTTQSFSRTDFTIETLVYENQNLILQSPNKSIYKPKEEVYNVDYTIDLNEKGRNIEFEINYSKSTNPQQDSINELINPLSTINNYRNEITNNNSTLLTNIDYTHPIESGILEIGLETRVQKAFNKIDTNQEVETNGNPPIRPKGNTSFNYDRNTYSGYINFNKEYEKIAIQMGIRFEQFNVNGIFRNTELTNDELYTDAIFSIYPSYFLTYTPSDKHHFQIGYSRRVDRPSIYQVTPIQEWVSPLTISVGNRLLVPQFTSSFELNYTKNLSKGYLTFGAFYRNTSNSIGRIVNRSTVNEDVQTISYTNYDTADSYGTEFSAKYKLNKWWTATTSTSLYIQDSEGIINNETEKVKNTLFKIQLNNSFKISKKLRFQLSGSYRGRSENVQFKIDPYYMINASARLSILNGNGSLNLRGTDVFNTYKLDFTTTNPFPQNGFYLLEIDAIYIGFNYNFGSGKNKERDRKYRDSNETSGSIL